ncbi:L-idonate 5-dehydrogenase [Telmatospirillum siberiense]|uniref:L-idonate 5-dehydrogenase n=1 Tax=Telmatospirillum siberiense TaxID=382514 RepID=A0A2N3PXV8_9PROT|nr:L-idonate 5-dehydrogenase [Telmatospirillum siberiense]PKU25238.1 L-idonate 5-dehydrogenase [Telmatospirillum siberiense]
MKALVIHPPHELRVEEVASDPVGATQLRIQVKAGGICGSDLHYYHHGGFGTVRVKEPMILGHEVSGTVVEVGAATSGIAVGQRIAISPSRPCGHCRYCHEGLQNHCLNMRFYGSAMPTPHIHGAFRQDIVIEAAQAHAVADEISDGEAAMAEPLSVALHALRRAGPILGRRVLVTGCGPIGALVIMAARRAGAVEIVATDLSANALATALASGADRVINTAEDPSALAAYGADKGTFDILFEASGSEKALSGALVALRPGGIIMQIGMGGEMTLPVNVITAKELDLRGSFRFHEEFAHAVSFLNRRLIDVRPLITASFPFTRFEEAFAMASDRGRAMKVQLTFA